MNFRLFEIHPDFEIYTLRNENPSKFRFCFLCEIFCFENNPLYGMRNGYLTASGYKLDGLILADNLVKNKPYTIGPVNEVD